MKLSGKPNPNNDFVTTTIRLIRLRAIAKHMANNIPSRM